MSKTFLQYDSRWGSKNYNGSSTMAVAGCGPTNVADIAYNMDTSITPWTVAQWMKSNGYAVYGNGTAHAGIPAALEHYGLEQVHELTKMSDVAKWMLQGDGYYAIFLFQAGSRGNVTWTTSGHFVAVTACKGTVDDPTYYTRDSGGRGHTGWYNYKDKMYGLVYKVWVCYSPKLNGKTRTSSTDSTDSTSTTKTTETTTATTGTKYTGEFPKLTISKTRAEVIADTIAFARWIASDNTFHYGHGDAAHHNGCYFCGTQPSSKKNSNMKEWEHTYCCNPYIHACYAHGGLIPSMNKICKNGSSFGFKASEGYAKSALFESLGHPKKATLKAGDVMCCDTHVGMVTVDGGSKMVEATHDDNVKGSDDWNDSIREHSMSDSKYNSFARVYRLKDGFSDFYHGVQHGDVSDDVALLQAFLTWYGTYTGKIDRQCGDKTDAAIRAFQKAEGLSVTGVFGKKNLAKAKTVTKAKTTAVSTAKLCIDTSYWNWQKNTLNQTNWDTIAKSVPYAFVRASYTSISTFTLKPDSTFVKSALYAKNAGIPKLGAYHYSQAITIAEAKKEANYICDIIDQNKDCVNWYVVCDYEFGKRLNRTKAKKLGKAKIRKIISAFCTVVKSRGYQPMVYVNYEMLTSYIDKMGWPLWYAQYSNSCSYTGDKVLWQYTSSGTISGIKGELDLSKVYE